MGGQLSTTADKESLCVGTLLVDVIGAPGATIGAPAHCAHSSGLSLCPLCNQLATPLLVITE